MHEMSSTVEFAKLREGMQAYGSDDRPIGTVDGLAPTGFRIGGVEYAGEAVARVADGRVYLHLTGAQAHGLRAPVAGEQPAVPLEPQRGPARGAPGSDHERRYGRNWSETDTGGTSGMGANRDNGDRGPTSDGEATGRAAAAARASRTRGADRAAWQGLREAIREGGDHAGSR